MTVRRGPLQLKSAGRHELACPPYKRCPHDNPLLQPSLLKQEDEATKLSARNGQINDLPNGQEREYLACLCNGPSTTRVHVRRVGNGRRTSQTAGKAKRNRRCRSNSLTERRVATATNAPSSGTSYSGGPDIYDRLLISKPTVQRATGTPYVRDLSHRNVGVYQTYTTTATKIATYTTVGASTAQPPWLALQIRLYTPGPLAAKQGDPPNGRNT
ncbi:hypothetical protein WOLCODRAFT_157429 [Wolfiporia cocos MD-104 SS10]|uniref:Uncharacterized protein n=1 Tax=Wolfiporia cocos (strain MD-104) TaxID=742152 RepID=A0A2H3JJ65_WOLCO|nr:hypothetical protein WOLCODRAFT_157429 [Wolfiporia cocos MD-104 SS10]